MTATPQQPSDVTIAGDPESLAHTYAEWLAARIEAKKGSFRIAICGGQSPQPLYRLLARDYRERIDWSKLEVFWGDERFVPHDAPDSNYRLAMDLWLSRVPIPPPHVLPFPTAGKIDDCARDYELILRSHYGKAELDPGKPLFDVVLLGVGDNGHTASLMPGSRALEEKQRWAVPMYLPVPEARLTLTYKALASARAITFLVTGAKKAEIVRRVRAGEMDLPAARVTSEGELLWFLDRSAAGEEQTQGEQ